MLDDSQPKYINSPETPVYTKGRNLYGLNFAKDACRDSEGTRVPGGRWSVPIPKTHHTHRKLTEAL